MPALTPSDAVLLGMIAKITADRQPNQSLGNLSRTDLLERLTEAARPLGNALVEKQQNGNQSSSGDPDLEKAAEFLHSWGNQQAR